MSKPTILNPWYIVQDFRTLSHLGQDYYYQSEYSPHIETKKEYEGDGTLTPVRVMMQESKQHAMIFTSLGTAVRVAASEGAHVRVLTNETELKEFQS